MSVQVFWWSVALFLFILELSTPMVIFIFPGISAFLIALLSYYVKDIKILTTFFFLGSFLFIMFFRPKVVGKSLGKGAKIGVDRILGMKCKVLEPINNELCTGRVQCGGDVFPARSLDGETIPLGKWVIVLSVNGITLTVKTS